MASNWFVTLSPKPDIQEKELAKLDALNKSHILKALCQCKGRLRGEHRAALLLGLNPNTLRSKMKRMGINAKAYLHA